MVNFYSEEEKKIRKALEDSASKYDWDGLKVNEIFHKCKFNLAIETLKKISSKKTIFEKKEVLNDVNNLIIEEAKNNRKENDMTYTYSHPGIYRTFNYV